MFYLTAEYLLHAFELWITLMLAVGGSFLLCIRPREFFTLLHEYTETPARDPHSYAYWLAEWNTEENDKQGDEIEEA
jgi:antitoxin component of MazEF toxin-antitoxin module